MRVSSGALAVRFSRRPELFREEIFPLVSGGISLRRLGFEVCKLPCSTSSKLSLPIGAGISTAVDEICYFLLTTGGVVHVVDTSISSKCFIRCENLEGSVYVHYGTRYSRRVCASFWFLLFLKRNSVAQKQCPNLTCQFDTVSRSLLPASL